MNHQAQATRRVEPFDTRFEVINGCAVSEIQRGEVDPCPRQSTGRPNSRGRDGLRIPPARQVTQSFWIRETVAIRVKFRGLPRSSGGRSPGHPGHRRVQSRRRPWFQGRVGAWKSLSSEIVLAARWRVSPLVVERRVGHDNGSFLGRNRPPPFEWVRTRGSLLIRRFDGFHPPCRVALAAAAPRFLPDG